MTALQILKDARKLIEKPEYWCRGHIALDCNYRETTSCSEEAVRWCAVGAIRRIGGHNNALGISEAIKFLQEAVLGKMYMTVTRYNDNYEHADVISLYDRAIDLASNVVEA